MREKVVEIAESYYEESSHPKRLVNCEEIFRKA